MRQLRLDQAPAAAEASIEQQAIEERHALPRRELTADEKRHREERKVLRKLKEVRLLSLTYLEQLHSVCVWEVRVALKLFPHRGQQYFLAEL